MTLVSGDGGGDGGGFAAGRAVKLRPPNQMLLLSYLFPCGEWAAREPNVQIQAKLIMNVYCWKNHLCHTYAKKKHTVEAYNC